MPRHPGLQAQNRFRELQQKLDHAICEVRNTKYDVKEATKKLEEATGAYLSANAHYENLKSLCDRLANNDGIFAWGLPESISIKEFKSYVPDADIQESDHDLEKQYQDKKLAAGQTHDR